MQLESTQLDHVFSCLAKYQTPTAGDFERFMSALRRATEIFDVMPDEIELHIFCAALPRYYGTDGRTSALGLIDEAIKILGALRVIYGYKLRDLTIGISEGFTRQQFRTAVLCCRALYEEAATAKYYCDQVASAIEAILQIPPSTFRSDRLARLAEERQKYKDFLDKIALPGKVLKKWHGVRKTKFNVFDNFKLNEKDLLYPGFSLSSFKTLKWQGKIPAPYYYSVLCEATHPNVMSNGLYADDTSRTNDIELVWVVRKTPKTIEPFIALFEFVSVPTIECVKILDDYVAKISELQSSCTKYVAKARRVTM